MFLCCPVLERGRDSGGTKQVATAVCTGDVQRARVGNPECLKAIRDLRVQTRGSVHLACKQAYYKKLKLDPSGVKCPRPWNSEATAVSVVGGNAPLRLRSDQDKPGRQAHLYCLD